MCTTAERSAAAVAQRRELRMSIPTTSTERDSFAGSVDIAQSMYA